MIFPKPIRRAVPSCLWVFAGFAVTASAACASAACAAETSPSSTRLAGVVSASQVSRVTFQGRAAFRISNGKNEAVVVPSLGRVMRFGPIGGVNWLWNNAAQSFKAGNWPNWGGDKVWPAPQSAWPRGKVKWPPHRSWDGASQKTEVLPNGHLQTTSGVWPVLECRIVREFWFDRNGDFVIRQTAEKTGGAPVQMSIWSIAQTAPALVFLPTNPKSVFKNNFQFLTAPKSDASATSISVTAVDESLLQIEPTSRGSYKIGADAPVSAIAAVKGDLVFLVRSAKPEADYPDGNSCIELFDTGTGDTETGSGNRQNHYVELEILGPIRLFHFGTKWTHTVRWSLHDLPKNADRKTIQKIVRDLLKPPESSTR